MFGLEVVVGIAEQGLGGGDEFRVVGAGAEEVRFVGDGRHGVDVGVVTEAGVGVVVVEGNFFDLREEAVVDLGEVGTREGAGLGGEGCGCRESSEEREAKVNQMFHFLFSPCFTRVGCTS